MNEQTRQHSKRHTRDQCTHHSPLTASLLISADTDSENSHRSGSPVSPVPRVARRCWHRSAWLGHACGPGNSVDRKTRFVAVANDGRKGRAEGAVKVRAGPRTAGGTPQCMFTWRAEPAAPRLHGGACPQLVSLPCTCVPEGDSARWPPGTRIRGSWRRRPTPKDGTLRAPLVSECRPRPRSVT